MVGLCDFDQIFKANKDWFIKNPMRDWKEKVKDLNLNKAFNLIKQNSIKEYMDEFNDLYEEKVPTQNIKIDANLISEMQIKSNN